MTFTDFAHRIGTVLRGAESQSAFTKSLFEMIIPEERNYLLEGISDSTWKSYFNGGAQITRLAKKINAYTDPMVFEPYISDQEEPAIQKLCDAFSDELPDIHMSNAGELIADLFDRIINEAAGNAPQRQEQSKEPQQQVMPFAFVAPDLGEYGADKIVIVDPTHRADQYPFDTYLKKAEDYYSVKRTLINLEQPQEFYDLFVCNHLIPRVSHAIVHKPRPEDLEIIKDATLDVLEKRSKYFIIEGTGGIGKSMFLTHLFLSSTKKYFTDRKRIPIFVTLKEYTENTTSFVELVWSAMKEYDPSIQQTTIVEAFENKSVALLLDGLDEISSSLRDSFDKDLEAFVKCYPGNTVVITSRPIHDTFLSNVRFFMYELHHLTLPQAVELIEKVHFWDDVSKKHFLEALQNGMYRSHIQFASNPLLLTIMLMTYSSFGDFPDDMHVFYAKAYETMARLHDRTKGTFQRPLHTKLTPEEFAKFFSQFCARTYADEVFEFTDLTFTSYMDQVIKKLAPEKTELTSRDFALDLTDNLCIMYHEGEKFYFIHRSFQEYFAAVHFASDFESKLDRVGVFFENLPHRSYSDHTFDMLYGLIPEKVERHIFLPFLKKMITECSQTPNEYWAFLESQYPFLYVERGTVGESNTNAPESFIYSKIREKKGVRSFMNFDLLPWPDELYKLPTRNWVSVYRNFIREEAFNKYPDPEKIPEELLDYYDMVAEDELPYRYADYFGKPEIQGVTVEIETEELLKKAQKYEAVCQFMESDEFPLMEEYNFMKSYCMELEKAKERENASHGLFDD